MTQPKTLTKTLGTLAITAGLALGYAGCAGKQVAKVQQPAATSQSIDIPANAATTPSIDERLTQKVEYLVSAVVAASKGEGKKEKKYEYDPWNFWSLPPTPEPPKYSVRGSDLNLKLSNGYELILFNRDNHYNVLDPETYGLENAFLIKTPDGNVLADSMRTVYGTLDKINNKPVENTDRIKKMYERHLDACIKAVESN